MDRKQFILDCREKRMTYAEIGKLLNVSRQRVQQVETGYKPKPQAKIKIVVGDKVMEGEMELKNYQKILHFTHPTPKNGNRK